MRHPASSRVTGAIVGLAVVACFAISLAAVLLLFGPVGIHEGPPTATLKQKPIAKMGAEELLEALGEPAGTIDCSVALEAAGVDVNGQKLTGLVWDQGATQGRLILVCAP